MVHSYIVSFLFGIKIMVVGIVFKVVSFFMAKEEVGGCQQCVCSWGWEKEHLLGDNGD